uniref:SNF2 subfamily protein n=1 Tax=Pithovirus LCPAC101 TaxID=2506586 RepID=A0A481Z4B0_9VIRU|nr:MAG: SNF2 subfamily protein [Pithovirus LCPAC101]
MTNIDIINGDICDSDTQYIAHQCNCVTNHAKGLGKTIFTKFPYSDIYSTRANYKDTPGNIIIRGDGLNNRYIINILSQFYPGKVKYNNDTSEKRKVWFRECLVKISQIPNISSI